MAFIYYAAVAATLFLFFHYLLSNFRHAILIGLAFTTFTLAGLPWYLVPFDPAAFAFQIGFLLLTFTWFLMRKNNGVAIRLACNHYLFGLFALEFLLLVYLLISERSGYGTTLVVWLLVKSILPVLAFGCLAPFDHRDVRLMSGAIIVGSVLTALRLFATGIAVGNDLQAAQMSLGADANPISVARVIGLGATLLIVRILLSREGNGIKTTGRVALAGMLLYAVAATGSRGPLVAAILTVPAAFVFLGHGPGVRRRIVVDLALVLVFLVGGALLLPSGLFEYGSIQRMLVYFDTLGANTSDRARLALFESAWNGFLASSGIGVGTGGFEAVSKVPDYRYPHNIVLEIAVSFGVIGLGLLFFLLAGTLRRIVKLSSQSELDMNTRPLMALWFYTLFNAMVSMDIVGNYAFWVSGGLVWLLTPTVAREASRATHRIRLRRPA